MSRKWIAVAVTALAVATSVVVTRSVFGAPPKRFTATLSGFQEVPAVSSTATGSVTLTVVGETIHFKLSYSGFPSSVSQSHIHFGQSVVNGGVSAFLCTNLGNGPAGTQACPMTSGTVSGDLLASDIVGPTSQNIGAGDIDKVIAAMRRRVTYADVHSANFPSGEIRGQLRPVS